MVLELSVKRNDLTQKKLERFNVLKISNFQDSLEDNDEIEMNQLSEWLKIHN